MTYSRGDGLEEGAFLLHRNKGQEHYEAEEFAQARKDLELARSIRDDDPDVMYWLAMSYFRLDQYGEAEELFRHLITVRPGHGSLHVNRGIALFKLERLGEADAEFRTALALGGGGNRAHLYLGLICARSADYREALAHFEAAGSGVLATRMREQLGLERADRTPVALARGQETAAGGGGVAPEPGEASPEIPHGEAGEERADPWLAPAGSAEGELLELALEGMGLIHRDALRGWSGHVTFDVMNRHPELLQALGDGRVYVVRPGSGVTRVRLDDGLFHVLLERFVAGQGEFAREVLMVGQVDGVPARALGLRGQGTAFLSAAAPVAELAVRPGMRTTMALERVLGWKGGLKVRVATLPGGGPALEFDGTGRILLDGPAAGPGREEDR